jgi:hypothetical protein
VEGGKPVKKKEPRMAKGGERKSAKAHGALMRRSEWNLPWNHMVCGLLHMIKRIWKPIVSPTHIYPILQREHEHCSGSYEDLDPTLHRVKGK